MTKNFLIATLIVVGLFSISPVFAQNYGLDKTAAGAGFKVGKETIESKASAYLNSALSVMTIVFFGFTLYSGIRWLTARGNEALVTKAKEALEAAIIGLVIVSLSWALTNFVFSRVQSVETSGGLGASGCCYYGNGGCAPTTQAECVSRNGAWSALEGGVTTCGC